MNKKGDILDIFGMLFIVFILIICAIVILGFIASILVRISSPSDNGEHYVQITALEDTGFIWQTTSVYVKSDISSSQEEKYCLDKTSLDYSLLRAKLETAAKNRDKVTIKYYDETFVGYWRCDFSDVALIKDVI